MLTVRRSTEDRSGKVFMHTNRLFPCDTAPDWVTDSEVPGKVPGTEELVRLAQYGDRAALAELCRRYAPLIASTVRRYRGLRPEWEDLTQSAFEAFVRSAQEFDPQTGVFFGHYIKLRVQGAVRTAVRRRELQMKRSRSLEEDAGPTEPGAHSRQGGAMRLYEEDGGMRAAFLRVEWEELLATLTVRERAAIEWTVLRGYRTQDLADRTNVGRETVKTWRRRGLRKLRAALARD